MHIQSILKQKWVIPVAASFAGIAAGAGAGFYIGLKKGENNIQDIVDEFGSDDQEELYEEIEEIEEIIVEDEIDVDQAYLNALYKEATDNPLIIKERVLSEEEVTALTKSKVNYSTPIPEEILVEIAVEEDVSPVNVFTNPDDSWDQEAEVAGRIEGEPHIIHIDEYEANETDYRQETLTYYKGDNVVCDAADTVVYGHAALMGELRFGHGSKDPNVVYIRNDENHMEWEILQHQSSYEMEVLGHQYEEDLEAKDLQHSYAPRKFRDD